MSAPLYFLPGIYRKDLVNGPRLSASILAGRGLLGIFGDLENLQTELSLVELTSAGPGGTSGTLLIPLVPGTEPPLRIGYYPTQQDWHNQGDQFWIGLDRESPPTPEDLRRRHVVAHYSMTLGDGHEWLIPVLRRPDGSSELPAAFAFDAAGQLSQRVRPAYRELWEEAGELAEWFVSGHLHELAKTDMPRLVDWCVRILAVNYRFDRVLQSLLGVVGTDDWLTLLAYAIDWFVYLQLHPQEAAEAQKKTASALTPETSSPSPSGPGNSSPGAAAAAAANAH